MHVVSFTGIQRYHKAVTGIHSVSLYQPGNVRCIEEGRDILFYFSGFDIGIQFQWLFIKERTDRNRDTFFVVFGFSRIRMEAFQHGSEIFFLLFLAVVLRVSYHAGYRIGVQISRVGITETTDHPVGEQILRSSDYRFRENRHCFHQIIIQIPVEESSKTGVVIQYYIAISGTFGPDTCLRIEAIIG